MRRRFPNVTSVPYKSEVFKQTKTQTDCWYLKRPLFNLGQVWVTSEWENSFRTKRGPQACQPSVARAHNGPFLSALRGKKCAIVCSLLPCFRNAKCSTIQIFELFGEILTTGDSDNWRFTAWNKFRGRIVSWSHENCQFGLALPLFVSSGPVTNHPTYDFYLN